VFQHTTTIVIILNAITLAIIWWDPHYDGSWASANSTDNLLPSVVSYFS
jgi:hypothetical protein